MSFLGTHLRESLLIFGALFLIFPTLLLATDIPAKFQNPQKLRKELIKFRRQFDSAFGKADATPCKDLKEGLGNDELAEGYKAVDEFIEKLGFSDFIFESEEKGDTIIEKAYTAYMTLSKFYKSNEQAPPSSISFCPMSSSLTCPAGKEECKCIKDWKLDPENDLVKIVNESSLEIIHVKQNGYNNCTLGEGSACRYDWQIKCNSPLKCFIKFDETLQPENELLCSYRNIEKYELMTIAKDDEKFCTCAFKEEDITNMLVFLYRKIINSPHHLSFGDPCDQGAQTFDTEFEEFVKHLPSRVTRSEVIKFYYKSQNAVQDLFNKASDAGSGRAVFCNKALGVSLVCRPDGTCGCHDSLGMVVKDKKTCVYKTHSSCHPDEPYQYDCQEGNECLIKIDVLGISVPCSDRNLNDIRDLDIVHKAIFKDDGTVTGCLCHDKNEKLMNVKKHFSHNDLVDLQRYNDELATQAVKGVEETCRNNWKIGQRGEACHWEMDRQFFQLDDFIRADLSHVYHRLHKYFPVMEELCRKTTDEDTNTDIQICDLTKGLRCDFTEKKCDCPIEHYLLEDIPSQWNDQLGKCELDRNKLKCHPTTSEWIACPDEMTCLYAHDDATKIKFKCDRKTRQKIIDEGILLKDATCVCSHAQGFYNHETIDKKIVKKFPKRKDEF